MKNIEFRNITQRYTGDAGEVSFPLGGIGTGNISIGARGELRDWEIFNGAGKGQFMPFGYFMIYTRDSSNNKNCRVLESELKPPYAAPYAKAHGILSTYGGGFPRFEKSELCGEYPYVNVRLTDSKIPVMVDLLGYTPFIPLDAANSGIPMAVLEYKVKNTTDDILDVSIVGNMANVIGILSMKEINKGLHSKFLGQNRNEVVNEEGYTALHFTSGKYDKGHLRYGNMMLAAMDSNVTYKPVWYRGSWVDGVHEFFDDFMEDGLLKDLIDTEAEALAKFGNIGEHSHYSIKMNDHKSPSPEGRGDNGSIGIYHTLKANEEKTFKFIISWYFPNRIASWDDTLRNKQCFGLSDGPKVYQNYYTNLFSGSKDVVDYYLKNQNYLDSKTKAFHDSFFASTLPEEMIQAISGNITMMRSAVCFRLKNGTFLAYEGSSDDEGSCPGNCTHVWNYAQSQAFLFPELERSLRKTSFIEETNAEGKMEFRQFKVFFEQNKWVRESAADGQLGQIINAYRDWMISGNKEFAAELWPKIQKVMDYSIKTWYESKDGHFNNLQHNTYDIEFYGPNMLTGSMMLGALQASIKFAGYFENKELQKEYQELSDKISNELDTELWNGEYYTQKLEDADRYKYQYGLGCLSDQLLGQLLSEVAGLNKLLPREKVKKTLESIMKYNFCNNLKDIYNCQRAYGINDDAGLLLCTWPYGGRPKFPFVYSDEVWSGIEYQVAAHMIYEELDESAVKIVDGCRKRYDGYQYNPWNDIECGHNYARAMASWALMTAATGFRFDLVNGILRFKPSGIMLNSGKGTGFFSCGKAWGTVSFDFDKATALVRVMHGNLDGVRIIVEGMEKIEVIMS